MKDFEYSVKVTIASEDIDNILADAFYGGITYWCNEIRYDKEPDTEVSAMSESLTKGAIIGVYDFEEDEWHQLTLDKVLQAVADEQVDFDDYDATTADNVVQRAIFGDVIYG